MDLKELLSSLSSPGDLAAILLGYASGFAIDVFYFPGGLPSGTVASVAAIGALGAKKAVEAVTKGLFTSLESKRQLRNLERKIEEHLKKNMSPELMTKLASSSDLWKQGLLKEAEFAAELEEIRLHCIKKAGVSGLAGRESREPPLHHDRTTDTP